MTPRLSLLAVLCLVPLTLRAQDVTPPDVASILKELDAMEQKQVQSKNAAKNALLSQLRAAAANGTAAVNAYVQAIEEVQFEGKKDKMVIFGEWKKKNADLLKSKELETALQLYFRYAALSVERKGSDNPQAFVMPTVNFINDLVAADQTFSGGMPNEVKDLLAKPLGQSVIAQSLKLGEWLPDDKSWELTPNDIAGMFDKNVRPILRDKKDPQLIATWDLQMKIEADRITKGRSEHEAEQFNLVARPKTQFLRAKDMELLGQPNRALIETIVLIRNYPQHPDFPTWVKKVRDSVKTAAPAAQTSPQ